MTFYEKIKLGSVIRVINPLFLGYFNDMLLIKCEGIIPTADISNLKEYFSIRVSKIIKEEVKIAYYVKNIITRKLQ